MTGLVLFVKKPTFPQDAASHGWSVLPIMHIGVLNYSFNQFPKWTFGVKEYTADFHVTVSLLPWWLSTEN